MFANGPRRLCYPTQAPPQISPGRPESCHAAPRRSEAKSGVQGGYGALFAVMVQILLSITRVAVQVGSEPRIYHRLQSWLGALAQCRGTDYLGARKLSRYIGTLLQADARVRVQQPLQICLEGRGISKKCDKLINPTVRVR